MSNKKRAVSWATLPAFALVTAACGSEVVSEAREAERDGRLINNEIMQQTYPRSFRAGSPQYLERDFEAGADFICDELELKHGRDLCAEPDINWRR